MTKIDWSGLDAVRAALPRQASILERIGARGFVTLEELAREFGVSAQTVRRDFIELEARGLLQRFHGGAGPPDASTRFPYDRKQRMATAAKSAIARRAAELVPLGGALFIDVGTTCEELARVLVGVPGLKLFTPSLPAALAFAGRDEGRVVVTGGLLSGADGSLVGDQPIAVLRRLRLDVAFIGLSGFDSDGAPMDHDIEKVAVKSAAMERARRVVLLADATKFGRSALVRLPVPRGAALVTDRAPTTAVAEWLTGLGAELFLAPGEKSGSSG